MRAHLGRRPAVGAGGGRDAVENFAWLPFLLLVIMGLPAAVGVAILRHRLYDIDVVINRALVYGPLTGSPGSGSTSGSVLVLQLRAEPADRARPTSRWPARRSRWRPCSGRCASARPGRRWTGASTDAGTTRHAPSTTFASRLRPRGGPRSRRPRPAGRRPTRRCRPVPRCRARGSRPVTRPGRRGLARTHHDRDHGILPPPLPRPAPGDRQPPRAPRPSTPLGAGGRCRARRHRAQRPAARLPPERQRSGGRRRRSSWTPRHSPPSVRPGSSWSCRW